MAGIDILLWLCTIKRRGWEGVADAWDSESGDAMIRCQRSTLGYSVESSE